MNEISNHTFTVLYARGVQSKFPAIIRTLRSPWALLTLLLWSPLSALSAQQGDFVYQIDGGGAVLARYLGPGGAVVIPDTLGGLPVTRIDSEAFVWRTAVTSVAIPNTVLSIGASAFYGCSGLTSLPTIPNSVTTIGEFAFSGCAGLTNVTIPGHVSNLAHAFVWCVNLKSVTIPDGVASISAGMFKFCSGLTSVTIPNSVISMGSSAFQGCGLTNVTIGSGLTTIPDSAFSECRGLRSVTIPNSVTSLGYSLFEDCTSLTNVVIPNSVTNIGNSMFRGCAGLTSLAFIPNSVTSIGNTAFYRCAGLTNVTIPNHVTSIGYGAFESCPNLTSIKLPHSVTRIEERAFAYCPGLTGLYFEGNAPLRSYGVFEASFFVTVFYRSGTTGWLDTFGDRPTALWVERPSYADWAVSTGLNAQFPAASAESDDADGDGFTNGDEWFAGTDPTKVPPASNSN